MTNHLLKSVPKAVTSLVKGSPKSVKSMLNNFMDHSTTLNAAAS